MMCEELGTFLHQQATDEIEIIDSWSNEMS